MYICICRAVTEKHIEEAVASGTETFRDLRLSLGVASCCGKCSDCAKRSLQKCMNSCK